MNKRIEELIEQATESTGFLTAGDSVKPLPVREFNKEKFAELIIDECANWINENVGMIDEDARADLYKHFGIFGDEE